MTNTTSAEINTYACFIFTDEDEDTIKVNLYHRVKDGSGIEYLSGEILTASLPKKALAQDLELVTKMIDEPPARAMQKTLDEFTIVFHNRPGTRLYIYQNGDFPKVSLYRDDMFLYRLQEALKEMLEWCKPETCVLGFEQAIANMDKYSDILTDVAVANKWIAESMRKNNNGDYEGAAKKLMAAKKILKKITGKEYHYD